jgi:hypothetical protein
MTFYERKLRVKLAPHDQVSHVLSFCPNVLLMHTFFESTKYNFQLRHITSVYLWNWTCIYFLAEQTRTLYLKQFDKMVVTSPKLTLSPNSGGQSHCSSGFKSHHVSLWRPSSKTNERQQMKDQWTDESCISRRVHCFPISGQSKMFLWQDHLINSEI